MRPTQAILKKYWGYDNFRPIQEEVIDAVLEGKDVLALLPTGGGKSVCFQVPAMIMEGVCLVVTPLIALMKDQVEQLNKRGIKAIAIYSGMSRQEIDIKLDNCIYGQIKFLYISPERLQTDIFRERLLKMKVSVLAVDEAHCISQWGYDFRPPYLHIAEIRELIPEVNIIALTATATPEVQDDIQGKLLFADPLLYQKSFARANLAYAVRTVEDKEKKLIEILKNVPGTAIVYARTRKRTREIAQALFKNNISADFYNAGLSHEDRIKKQDNWITNRRRVMVATNAFGMGIDKPDVRVVVHMDLPQDLESYYQEAGRAGRDEKKAYAVIVHHKLDIEELRQRVLQQHPTIDFMKKVYQGLANYYKMAVGSGEGQSYDFEIQDFADNYQLNHMDTYYALKKLEEEELIQFNESFYNPSQLHIKVDNKELYEFQVANGKYDIFLKTLLRIYGGELFNNFVKIAEVQIGRMMELDETGVVGILQKLNDLDIVNYDQKKDKPQLIYTVPRQDASQLKFNHKRLESRKKTAIAKMEAIVDYVSSDHTCRTQLLLEYFGETSYGTCGVCDVCVAKKQSKNDHDIEKYHLQIKHLIKEKPLTVEELMDNIDPGKKDIFLEVIRQMIDSNELKYDDKWKLAFRGN